MLNKRTRFILTFLAMIYFSMRGSAGLSAEAPYGLETLRAPAVPLVACDPYFSIWSQHDTLTGGDTTHWTGKPHRLVSTVTVDGKRYAAIGKPAEGERVLDQTSVAIYPTRTVYQLHGGGVHVELTFLTPALPDSIDLLSRPVTYVIYEVTAADGKQHEVVVDFVADGDLVVNEPQQEVEWSMEEFDGLVTLKCGSVEQPVLMTSGDDRRIDWGYLYVAAPSEFASTNNNSLRLKINKVTKEPQHAWLMLVYDDLYSIQYMGTNLRPYWRRNGWEADDLLKASAQELGELRKRCETFDAELLADLQRAGGDQYAQLGALCFRHCFAAGKFVADANGQPLQFSKENHSNGCIATSDVFYPMAPQFLLFGPSLAKSFIVPFMNYAASDRWKFPFAPHDLGQYPHANGQVYGGGERSEENQMPVEESGNMLLLMAAVAQMEGNADFAGLYWKQLTAWANYLKEKGFDPENQLCTDDFAGHLAHNVNLSAKAICGLGAYAKLCAMRGDTATAQEYRQVAKQFAVRWVKEAADGDHFRLSFDRPGTWSQKYNLVWDRILGLELFPAEVYAKEMAYYRKIQNEFGLPLDNRETYTKLDWVLWSATLTQNQDDFAAILAPVMHFIQTTPDRAPLTDWYRTQSAKKVGFTARPVVGGVFLQMLYDPAVWSKWAGRDQTHAGDWAPLPKAPEVRMVLPTAMEEPAAWRYTTTQPSDDWSRFDFDASAWQTGQSGFGTRQTPGAAVHTEWTTGDIWLVRDVELEIGADQPLSWLIHHDEAVEVYVNGALVLKRAGYTTKYQLVPLTERAREAIRTGKNRIAIHCHQTSGGQYIDLGLAEPLP
jgi:hypothetical protein